MPHGPFTFKQVWPVTVGIRANSAQIEAEMAHKMTTSQRFDSIEQQLNELAGVPDRLIDITSFLDHIDLDEVEQLKSRVTTLEKTAARVSHGELPEQGASNEQLGAMNDALETLHVTVETMAEDVRATIEAFKKELVEMNAKLNTTMLAVGKQPVTDYRKVKVPEPQSYGGARDAKELENFLFDMEQYFRAVKPDSEEGKVNMATMYLSGDAKLWWRTKFSEIQRGVCTIDTWEDLKREIKTQFFPENVEYIARRKLRELEHTNNIRDFVNKFFVLMLDIPNM